MNESKMNSQNFINATNISGITSVMDHSDGLIKSENAKFKVEAETKRIKTSCRACISNCGVIAHVKDGRVIKLEGNPEDPMSKGRMCAKGLSSIQALYHPNRNKYPMKRVGERGGNQWKRISWDEAIDTIARKLMDARENYGAESVVCSTGGGGNPEIWSIARFCNIFGTPNWFEPGCAQCYLPRVLSYTMMYGGDDPSIADSNALEIYDTAGTEIQSLVMWGTVPSYSCPASGGGAVADIRAKGVKTVVIDPRFTPDAAKANVWLPIRPGTDVALMLAWIRYILDEKLYDQDFLMKWTNLPYLVDVDTKMLLRAEESSWPGEPDTFMVWDQKTNSPQALVYPWNDALEPALEGTFIVDGVVCQTGYQLLRDRVDEFTIEKAAETCQLDPNKIIEAIEVFANNTPGGLAIGVATDHTPNSVQAAMAAATLDLIMGNVEKPGTLLQRFNKSGTFDMPNYPVPIAAKRLPNEQLKKRLGAIEHKGLHIWYAAQPAAILEAMLTDDPYKLKVWIDRSGNKLASVANSKKWVKAMEKLDLIVHMFMYPTSFSSYADILLPTEEWLETDMMVETCNTLVARQAVTHLWETVDETVIWSKLAKRLGELGHEECKNAFDADYMGDDLPYWESVDEIFDHFLGRIDLTWNKLKEISPYEYMPKKEWKHYYRYLDIDPVTNKPGGFETPSKKCEIYLESMITLGRTGKPFSPCDLPPASVDYDPLPYFMEPHESPLKGSELAKEFPLVMTGGRIPYFHHNTMRNIPYLREIYPVPELWIHPTAAETYGITEGDWVWVESKRGKIRAVASVTEGINPGTVYMERFWNPETLNTETHGWKEMNVNVLTKDDAPFNDVVGTYTLRAFLVKVSKADGPPEGIWTKPEEFKSWLPEASAPTAEVK